ncbi:MAG TPA: hypothetical protein VK427_11500, partial [Kofleriaceae bacterium]|nr:hypothetical protein [Kofleriaceae bacterium]
LVRGVADDSATWFTRSRKPGTPTWAAEISNGNGAPVVGFVDTARFLADAQGQVPAIAQCASQLQLAGNLGRVGIALSGDPQVTRARFSVDVGALAPRIASSALAVPEGFAKAVAQAPLAVQWNLDLAAVRARLDPCMRLFDVDLGAVEQIGIRAGRAFVRTFDADEREGTGALSLDLAHKRFLADKLDDIPLRSTLERKRTFGPYAGKSLSIPMFLSVDYVLQDQLALAGVGDGLLLAMIGSGGSVPGPLAELAVQPLGLSVESWTALFELAEIHNANAVATQLQRWREVRVNLAIEGTRLVLAASGTRR